MSYVIKNWRVQREVLNLGWLLAHSRDVRCFEVKRPGLLSIGGAHVLDKDGQWLSTIYPDYDAWLIAYLRGGTAYATQYASQDLLHDWLDRPKFRGLYCLWFGVWAEIGTEAWSGKFHARLPLTERTHG